MVVPRKTTSEWTLWIVAVSCPVHAAEEYFTGWQEWARQTLGIVMPTPTFLFINAVLVTPRRAIAIAGLVGVLVAVGVVAGARWLSGAASLGG